MQFFQEGLAFGAAWAASLEQGRTIPAQWRRDLAQAAASVGVPISATGTVASNRDAFVTGFDLGIRIVMERRSSFRAPNGRVYTLDFLIPQGRVAANNLFGQARPTVLPEIAGPTGMAPATPGAAQLSTYDRFVQLARMAPSGMSRRADRSDPASVWIAYLLGNQTPVISTPSAVSLNGAVLARIRGWALSTLSASQLPEANAAYLRAIAATPWVPSDTVGSPTYSSGISSR
jgi:hypothetical protein